MSDEQPPSGYEWYKVGDSRILVREGTGRLRGQAELRAQLLAA